MQATLELDSSSLSITEKCPDLSDSSTTINQIYEGDDLDAEKNENFGFI